MWIRESEPRSQLNWIAIISYAGAFVYSLLIWASIISAVEHFVH